MKDVLYQLFVRAAKIRESVDSHKEDIEQSAKAVRADHFCQLQEVKLRMFVSLRANALCFFEGSMLWGIFISAPCSSSSIVSI